jgi:hypothetical protein
MTITDEMVERVEPADTELADILRKFAQHNFPQQYGYGHHFRLAAQRLDVRSEITKAMVERAARALCKGEYIKCRIENCDCAAGRNAARAALEAALSGKEE